MEKDFDSWNEIKKIVEKKIVAYDFNYHEGEIWWTSLGLNVGSEIDGKHENFERPVLVLRAINKHTFFGVPITSKNHPNSKYHYVFKERMGCAVFSQLRVISTHRLLRKIDKIEKTEYEEMLTSFLSLFQKSNPRTEAGILESSDMSTSESSILSSQSESSNFTDDKSGLDLL